MYSDIYITPILQYLAVNLVLWDALVRFEVKSNNTWSKVNTNRDIQLCLLDFLIRCEKALSDYPLQTFNDLIKRCLKSSEYSVYKQYQMKVSCYLLILVDMLTGFPHLMHKRIHVMFNSQKCQRLKNGKTDLLKTDHFLFA
ncbi:hypothetical protein BCV71DRAFT_233844 [Rhizopus microsporus]|uniref:Uncharacterized protein n=1 Tax=Rhizopus microsporus TaxID=58291 RepID=A0A1X0S5T1_RHIZD|nr:hypothetical protein BCV71DRAFT_233844 [Rhizopus microsporus]